MCLFHRLKFHELMTVNFTTSILRTFKLPTPRINFNIYIYRRNWWKSLDSFAEIPWIRFIIISLFLWYDINHMNTVANFVHFIITNKQFLFKLSEKIGVQYDVEVGRLGLGVSSLRLRASFSFIY